MFPSIGMQEMFSRAFRNNRGNSDTYDVHHEQQKGRDQYIDRQSKFRDSLTEAIPELEYCTHFR